MCCPNMLGAFFNARNAVVWVGGDHPLVRFMCCHMLGLGLPSVVIGCPVWISVLGLVSRFHTEERTTGSLCSRDFLRPF